MEQFKVKVDKTEIQHFCHILGTCKSDFDIQNNSRAIVDGKSIMGLFTLDVTRPLNIQCVLHENETLNEIKEKLKKYVLEENKQ